MHETLSVFFPSLWSLGARQLSWIKRALHLARPKMSHHRWSRVTWITVKCQQGWLSFCRKAAFRGCHHPLSLPFPPGLLCEENIDDCAGGPHCLNGGQCVDRIGGYSCRCLPGFAGERCEGDINECLSNPCSSEGSLDCIQLTNDYLCVCRSAFTGESLPAAPRALPLRAFEWGNWALRSWPRPKWSFSYVWKTRPG